MGMEVAKGYAGLPQVDVEYARKGVDPVQPADGTQVASGNSQTDEGKTKGDPAQFGPAVTFGGQLAPPTPQPAAPEPYMPGSKVNIST